jgi:hypothetical protein
VTLQESGTHRNWTVTGIEIGLGAVILAAVVFLPAARAQPPRRRVAASSATPSAIGTR